jgi:TadE-like protein
MHSKGLRRGWDDGSTAVEAAVVFPLLFALIFGIVEFGMALWQWNTMELAVLEAGRYAMINNASPVVAEHKIRRCSPAPRFPVPSRLAQRRVRGTSALRKPPERPICPIQ